MGSKGAGVTWRFVVPMRRHKGRQQHASSPGHNPLKNPQEKRRHYPWLGGYLQWLEGKEAREEYYGRLERMSGR